MAASNTTVSPDAPRLATLHTGAAYCDVTVRTIRRWIDEGHLTGYRLGVRVLRIDLDEVEALARPIPTGGDR